MKKKSIPELPKVAPPPSADQWPKELEKIPLLKKFKGKTPIDALTTINPRLGEIPKAKEAMAGLMAGLGVDLLIPIPEWAKAASKKFWEASGIAIAGMDNWQPQDLGKITGAWEISNNGIIPEMQKYVNPCCDHLKSEAANASAEISKQFFDGRASADAIKGKMKFLPQRSKAYLAIATTWFEVEKLDSAAQLHNWLLGHKVILPVTDSADTRKVCRAIGLKFKSKAGRPRKRNPVTD